MGPIIFIPLLPGATVPGIPPHSCSGLLRSCMVTPCLTSLADIFIHVRQNTGVSSHQTSDVRLDAESEGMDMV